MAETNSIFLDLPDFYNKKINSEPRSETNIAIDTKKTLTNEVIAAEEDKSLNIGDINSFSQQSQNRNQIYNIIDQMCEDSTLSAALETYAEDATEYNDEGKIVWCESNDTDVANYINYLLQTMRIDKNIYKWVASLCKYGDLYLRLYRKSEYNDSNNKDRDILNEDVKIYDYKKDDKFVHYLEMASNPAEMFELTKFGKTYGYIKANVNNTSYTGSANSAFNMYDSRQFTYKFKKNDIEIYDAMSYAHASLDDNLNRFPEEVNIFIDKDGQETQSTSYSVKRGQSIFFNVYKTWRYVKLLEDAILLNRVSKSSITRIINVEVGDMPKENVQPCLQRIKSLIEQKAALSVNQSINEYTNPGPIDNAIYIPTYNGKGTITEQTLSTSDADIKSIVDLEYFKNNLWAALKIPKQFMSETSDSTGFNGGTSLSLISSRYAKTVKRIQNTILQALTDAINIMLVDKQLTTYIGKFTLKMVPPMTQEENDRRESKSNTVDLISNFMSLFDMIEDPVVKLKMLKSFVTDVITDTTILNLIQEEIDKLESSSKPVEENIDDSSFDDNTEDRDININVEAPKPRSSDFGPEIIRPTVQQNRSFDDLPSPTDLNIDMTDSNNSEFD